MLKQVFDIDQLSKVISSSDIWQWGVLSRYGDIDTALDKIVQYWRKNNLNLLPLETRMVKNKLVFIPANMEDAFAIKLLDRFVRRIYKVRQSDRNRIIRQLKTILKDSGKYHVLRLDIKDCYETIRFKSLIDKFEDELILAPECIDLLRGIHRDLYINHDLCGLPRGLSISPTLAELYLEILDKKIASLSNVIYSARYVDDIIIITPTGKEDSVQSDIEDFISEMGLKLNNDNSKYYCGASCSAEFNYLGYSIKVDPGKKKKPNNVALKISRSKLNKIKSRIVISFLDYKKQKNTPLLKRRLEYLCMLKIVRKGKNRDLLAGLAHNYQHVTDEFECLKSLDGFLFQQLMNPRFGLNEKEKEKIKKISIYGNTKKKNIGNFSKRQTVKIMQVWKNA